MCSKLEILIFSVFLVVRIAMSLRDSMIFKGKDAVRILGTVFPYLIKVVGAMLADLGLFPFLLLGISV